MNLKSLASLALLLVVVGCVPQEKPSTTPETEYGTRVNLPTTGYISLSAGIVYDCTNVECIQLAVFNEGQPLPVIGMIYADSGWWYVVGVQRGLEGFVPSAIMEYDYRLNITPIPPVRTNSI